MLAGLITICGGILAASSFIVAKKPNAKQLIDKMVPYQGWIGIVMFCWGVFGVLGVLGTMSVMSVDFSFWLLNLLSVAANLVVGFILGFALISKYALNKNEAAQKKGEAIRMKLLKFQIPFGFLAIAVGVLYLVVIYT